MMKWMRCKDMMPQENEEVLLRRHGIVTLAIYRDNNFVLKNLQVVEPGNHCTWCRLADELPPSPKSVVPETVVNRQI